MSTLGKMVNGSALDTTYAIECTMPNGSVIHRVYTTAKGLRLGIASIERDMKDWPSAGWVPLSYRILVGKVAWQEIELDELGKHYK